MRLGHALGRQPQRRPLLDQRTVGHERGHRKGAVLGHHARSVFIDQVAVLDGAHAAAHGMHDRLGRVGMRHHVGMAVSGLGHDGADLVLGVAERIDRVGRRGHAAAGHDLDLRRAHLQFLAHGLAHRIHAVHHARHRAEAERAGAGLDGLEMVAARPEVPVAAGLRHRAAADEQARPRHQALRDRIGQRRLGAAGIAHAGEAAHQHVAQQGQ